MRGFRVLDREILMARESWGKSYMLQHIGAATDTGPAGLSVIVEIGGTAERLKRRAQPIKNQALSRTSLVGNFHRRNIKISRYDIGLKMFHYLKLNLSYALILL